MSRRGTDGVVWVDLTMQVYAHALEGDDATAAETTATANAIFDDRDR